VTHRSIAPRRPELQGYLLVGLAATLWGTSAAITKSVLLAGVSPEDLVAVRLSGALLVLLPFVRLRRRRLPLPSRQSLPWLAVLGITFPLVTWTYYLAIWFAGVATAVFLQYQAPVILAGLGLVTGRDRPGRERLLAIGLAMLGCYLLVTGGADGLKLHPAGVAAGLASAALWALYALGGEALGGREDPWDVLLWVFFVGTLAWSAARSPAAAWPESLRSVGWPVLAVVAILGTLAPLGLYLAGLRTLTAGKATLTATLEPAVAAVAAYLMLGEALALTQIAGASLVLGAVLSLRPLSRPERKAQD
jgi:drug/metabolite transporter (DMT)-like permease